MTLLLLAFVLSIATPQTPAQSAGTPEARAAYEAGTAAVRACDNAKGAALFRKAIDVDPRFVDAHDEFIDATEMAAYAYDPAKRAGNAEAQKQASQELNTLYEGWSTAHPDNP